MLSSSLSILLALQTALSVNAAPAKKRAHAIVKGSSEGLPSWVPASHPSIVGLDARDLDLGSQCDLQNAAQNMDLSAASDPAALPAPASNLQLYHVAIGRGTQNYTCDLSNSTAVPVSIGAAATLFNASCLASQSPALLAVLPAIALDLPIPTDSNFESIFMPDVSGHHYFTDNFTTPYFNLDTSAHQYGQGPMNKTGAADAPTSAPQGRHGAVQWLQLESKKGHPRNKFRQVYRLNTAGGDAPKTCQGQKAHLQVQYAAQYWFFTGKA